MHNCHDSDVRGSLNVSHQAVCFQGMLLQKNRLHHNNKKAHCEALRTSPQCCNRRTSTREPKAQRSEHYAITADAQGLQTRASWE
ncbi:hypothetical protein SKAU_G00375290 [Synaphobranchus kaupii]|uniref:Uncharacterized protein n=1 Tax=Synaphobranchus kaupii TaxID=118154 RepID=A0A9Q1IE87_SYNKA|nr:hypothetical protein SKAU_G00375290 [Synaphobranchus kaupii]